MEKCVYILLYVLCLVYSEEIYQNSSHICEKCKCSDSETFSIDCSDQKFQHVLANWPPHNTTLISIFSNNNITTLERLPYSDQKAKLVFDHCGIKYLDSGVFSNIRNVEFIDLSYNLLTTEEIDGDDFKGPYNNSVFHPIALKYLNLAYNQIHSLPRKFFENMLDLEELNLEGNDFSVLDPQTQTALATLSKLKILNLANNELTELEEDAVRNMHNLRELDLSSNRLDFVPDSLDYLSKSLKVLKLSNNYIFELNDKSFLGLDVTELQLNNLPRLEYVGSNSFATLQHLQKLQLYNNTNLRGIDKEAFRKNQSLDELLLSNNSLYTIPFELLNWSHLKIMKIDENPLNCDCDLYNISRALSDKIRRTSSPICFDPAGRSYQIYLMDGNNCNRQDSSFHITQVTQHFDTIRITIIIMSALLIMGTIVAIAIGLLRYKKSKYVSNYTFAANVSYNPLRQTQHI